MNTLSIRFIIKMDYTSIKHINLQDTASKSNHRKYTNQTHSPKQPYSYFNSPHLEEPHKASIIPQSENAINLYISQQNSARSPICPLAYSRSSPYVPITGQEYDHIIIQQRSQIQALLLEINRLQNLLFQSSELKSYEIQKLKQEYESSSYMQMSTFRQNQNAQIEVFELQVRKLKEQLKNKQEEYGKLEVQLSRERQSSEIQKKNMQEEVRHLIEKKNAQIYELKQEEEKRVRKIQNDKNSELAELKYLCDKEMNSLNRILQNKNRELAKLANNEGDDDKSKDKIIEKLQREKDQIESKYEKKINEHLAKYQHLKANFNKINFEVAQNEEKNWKQLQSMFNSEYSMIFELVKKKDREVEELRKQVQLQRLNSAFQINTLVSENNLLKGKLKEQAQSYQKQLQLLKVKISLLHQTDITQLKDLYSLKLKNEAEHISRLDQENNKLREMLHIISNERYEAKKRHDIITSELNSKILKMRMGISSLETDFKEKIQNEKSLMLMTSRSFLKEAEVKNHNNKFLEQEIRKLRQLMDLQNRENENAEKAVEEKIMAASNELERLSDRLVKIAQQKKQLQDEMNELRLQKDNEIAKLKADIDSIEMPQKNIKEQLALIDQLKEERLKYLQQIGILKDRVHTLESRMNQMNAELQRYHMEHQINQEEAKNQYHDIAESHLLEFKKFYQEKLRRVEDEKGELKKIISSQYQQITELIKKYKELEEGMKETITLMKKRTALEEKVLNIGLDNNLIKNLSQLLPSHLKI